MVEQIIATGEHPLKTLLWNKKADSIIVFIGGSGDDKQKFVPLVERLVELGVQKNLLTFSFRGVEERVELPLRQQVEDLKEVLDWTVQNNLGAVTLISTSMGAFSASLTMVDHKYQDVIVKSIFVDPADYYVRDFPLNEYSDWHGFVNYSPIGETGSSSLKKGIGSIKVDLINLTLRNFSRGGYAVIEERGIDNSKLYPRLNDNMVRSFYENPPEQNRGKYIENNEIPHAFMRDGNLHQNVEKLANLLFPLL